MGAEHSAPCLQCMTERYGAHEAVHEHMEHTKPCTGFWWCTTEKPEPKQAWASGTEQRLTVQLT